MDIILLERIERLGQMGDVVKVRPGFARNYLLPQRKALRATKENKSLFEAQRAQLEAINLKRREEAQAAASPLDGMVVTLIRQASDMGQLYGSVTSRDLAEAVTENGVTIQRNQIVLNRPIKSLGLHMVRVALHPEVSVEITANVARTHDEAAVQLQRGSAVLGTERFEEDQEDQEDLDREAAAEAEAAEGEAGESGAPEEAETGESTAPGDEPSEETQV